MQYYSVDTFRRCQTLIRSTMEPSSHILPYIIWWPGDRLIINRTTNRLVSTWTHTTTFDHLVFKLHILRAILCLELYCSCNAANVFQTPHIDFGKLRCLKYRACWEICTCLWSIVVRYWLIYITFRLTSLAMGQSYNCPTASEVTLKNG